MRNASNSPRLPSCFDELRKIDEELFGVVRAGGGFGVVLDGEDGVFRRTGAFHGAVIQVDMSDFGIGGEVLAVGGEAVVLSGDFDFTSAQILHGLVASAVTELEFVGLSAGGVSQKLMTEANSKEGSAADEFTYFGMNIVEGRGVAGAVGEKDAVRAHGEDVFGRSGGGHDGDIETFLTEAAQDVALNTKIVGHDFVFGFGKIEIVAFDSLGDGRNGPWAGLALPMIGLVGGDLFDEVGAKHGVGIFCRVDGFLFGKFGRQAGAHRAG